MITGRLQVKKDKYYMIINYKDVTGNYKKKWVSTGLPAKGNKTRANAMLREAIGEFEEEARKDIAYTNNPLFSEYMEAWLKSRKKSLQPNTYMSYRQAVMKSIVPYFEEKKIKLLDLKPSHISTYYNCLMDVKGNGANTVKHHHANIHKALKQAYMAEKIPGNPADKIELPKDKEHFRGDFYDVDEINELFRLCKGDRMELAILVAGFYGLRRSEVLGLRWKAINFKNQSITISHVVTSVVDDDGVQYLHKKEKTKNATSLRTLPLLPQIEEALKREKEKQAINRKLCGREYCTENLEYIFVDEMGNLIKPNYITHHFKSLLKNLELRHIRFHDLRHSCASLLLASGVDLKRIQEWLGHASIETTSKFYSHMKFDAKIESGNIISGQLTV